MGGLLWTVDLGIPGRNQKDAASTGLKLPQVRTLGTSGFANPASITIRNVTSENNQSLVECSSGSSGMSNAAIIVEGKGSITNVLFNQLPPCNPTCMYVYLSAQKNNVTEILTGYGK